MPASAITSASPSFWQVMPLAPAAICSLASIGLLWVLICGRLATPAASQAAWIARDVALDAVHVDDGGGRAVVAGDFGGEGCGHQVGSSSASSSLRERSDEAIHAFIWCG